MREMHMWTRGGPSCPPMPLHTGRPGRRPAGGDIHPAERFERSAIPKGLVPSSSAGAATRRHRGIRVETPDRIRVLT